MMTNNHIHPFSTLNAKYIYDTTSNSIFKITDNLYSYLTKKDDSSEEQAINELANLNRHSYISNSTIEEIRHPLSSVLPRILAESVQGITLQVTQQCNLRCKYCVYSGAYESRGHSSKRMPYELAQKGVEFLIERSAAQKSVNIGFYGGEPLLEFKLIERIVRYIKEKYSSKDISFSITTNGTLLNDRINSFLQDNDFNVMISLDGPKEIHDQNRIFHATGKGTFDTILKNISDIRENYKHLFKNISFNAVIDPKLNPSCTNHFFLKSELFDETFVSASIISPDFKKDEVQIPDDFIIQDETETFKVLLNKIGRIKNSNVSKITQEKFANIRTRMVDLRKKTIELSKSMHPSGPCVPGARKLFMSATGEFYPCERVSESSANTCIGDIENGFNFQKVDQLLNIGKLTEDKCKKCWAIRFCTHCVAAADDTVTLNRQKKIDGCEEVFRDVHSLLTNYITLKEYGYNFDNEIPVFKFQESFPQ